MRAGIQAVSLSDEETDEETEEKTVAAKEEGPQKKMNVIEKLGAGIAMIGKRIEEVRLKFRLNAVVWARGSMFLAGIHVFSSSG